MFDSLRDGLAAPLGGMGISFSSSLFGLAGSLMLGLPRPAVGPGAEPVLHRSRRLAVHHGAGPSRRITRGSGRRFGRWRRGSQRTRSSCASTIVEHRIEQGRHQRHGQSGRGDPGHGPPHAPGAADDPQLGRRPGRADQRNEAAPGNHRPARERRGAIETWRSPAPAARGRLLAGLRRRAVDAGARHHLPADGLRGGAVLPLSGSRGQGHGAVAPQRRRSRSCTDLLSLETTGKVSTRGPVRAATRVALAAPRASATLASAADGASQGAAPRDEQLWQARPARSRRPKKQISARARRPGRLCSTSRSPRCAGSSARSKRRCRPPRRRIRTSRRRSPISASGSTSPWRSACRN